MDSRDKKVITQVMSYALALLGVITLVEAATIIGFIGGIGMIVVAAYVLAIGYR